MSQTETYPPHPGKLELIDRFAQTIKRPWRFADLGGVWGVHGIYSFHALTKPNCAGGYLVDTHPSPIVLERAAAQPKLQIVTGNFGDPLIAENLGQLDAVFLFDVLLHQVKPDWPEILAMYGERTSHFLIFNQQYLEPKTTRLLDLGEDEFFRNVPHDRNHPAYQDLFRRLDEIHPVHQRPWRDVHHIWQWGITDRDLHEQLTRCGFQLDYFRSWERVHQLKNFENHAFLYRKK